jgi:oligoendopeptidase F
MRPVTTTVLVFALSAVSAHATERADVPESLKWGLSELFASPEAWDAARAEAVKQLADLAAFRGHAGDSPDALARTLGAVTAARLRVSRLALYAMMRFDEDTRVAASQARKQLADQLRVDLDSAVSWLRPELLALGEAKLAAYVAADPRLRDHAFFLEDLARWKPHTLSPAEEKVAAEAGTLAGAGEAIYSVFTNADLPYPEITLSTGEKARLDAAAFARYRSAPSRADREAVFKAFFGVNQAFTRTLGTTLSAQVRAHLFDARIHHFDSALDAALFADNIPRSVYTQLIADVHRSLPTLHRYLRLRQRMMELPDLEYSDLYAPIVKKVDLRFTPEQAKKLTLEAFAPLGPKYVEALARGYESRWVDFMPSTGKRSGAYSESAWGIHPYQLLNFNGGYYDASTLAHESGHSMHSFLADAAQPYPTASYATFVAEVASTLNENLFLHHMLATTSDDATRLFILGSYLENLRTTLFRQTLFAELELDMHTRAEKGEPVTGEWLDERYLQLLRTYYGEAEGVCKVDALYGAEWAYIEHFYLDFYVYQYATSVVASLSLAGSVRDAQVKGDPRARDAYLAMLAAGGSRYAVELLRSAGVDMTTPAPFAAAMTEVNRIMDEMEAILARQKKPAGKPGK